MKYLSNLLLMVLCLFAMPASDSWAQEFKAVLGQSSAEMTGKWQFHTGDDMRWANPEFDDSKWDTITAEKPWGMQGHPGYTGFAWYRRAVEIDGVAGPVSIYIPNTDNAYEIYWNGNRVGGFGKLPPDARWQAFPVSRVIALSSAKPDDGGHLKGVIAIRVWKAMPGSIEALDGGGISRAPRIGESQTMMNALALEENSSERGNLVQIILEVLIFLVGIIAVILWILDRRRALQGWLGVFLLGHAARGVFNFPALFGQWTFQWEEVYLAVVYSARDLGIWMLVLVLFGLYREHRWRRATGFAAAIYLAAYTTDVAFSWFWSSGWPPLRTIDRVTTAIYCVVPTYLFVLLFAGLRRRRDLSLLPAVIMCTAMEAYLLVVNFFAQLVQFSGINLFRTIVRMATIHFGPYTLNLIGQLEVAVTVVLVATVYREQARERRRQLFVESELRSAQEIQQVLVPEGTPAIPGFAIGSLYWPAGEVGGDMFQVLPDEEGGCWS